MASSLGAPADEESLTTGFERQLDRVRGIQQQMSDYVSDLDRLKEQCNKLKSERTAVMREVTAAEEERNRVRSDIARIEAQRDSVQIEYAALLEDNMYLRGADAYVSAELAEVGRLNRRLWFQTEKIAELERRLRDADAAQGAAVQVERKVAAGLRDRIGRLEQRLRDKEGSDNLEKERARSASLEAEHEMAVLRSEMERLRRENADARDALAVETKASRHASRRVDVLESQLQEAREEARHYKEAAVERDALRKELAAVKGLPHESRIKLGLDPEVEAVATEAVVSKSLKETRPLQTVSPNTPLTPTKPRPVPSPKPTPSSHARRLAHVESQHAALKSAHDQLKTKYERLQHKREEERRHFKEYHAVQMAKKEAKRKRREMVASGAAASSAPTPTPPSRHSSTAAAPQFSSQQPEPNVADGVAEADRDEPSEQPPAKRLRQSPPPALDPEPAPPAAVTPRPAASAATATPAPTPETRPVPLPQHKAMSTPTAARATPLGPTTSRQPTRVTPWLGGSTRTSARAASTGKLPRRERDSFGSDSDEEADGDTPVPPSASNRTPLVRDRTGTSFASDGLRRQALTARGSAAPAAADTSIATTPTRLNFEGMSPGERAAERKRLSRLSISERREVYAGYKGKGRYVAPEDVKKTFADEYEVDPAKNNGVAHQYHDTVRNRAERRKMHGGDCECCRDYYEAVGEIPRFNAGPIWKDTSPERDGMDIEDHQNRISRHREVWRRPPTPPGFWAIGFPTTQDVEDVNKKADEMTAQRDAEVRREAAHKDSKWRKKA